MRRDLVLGWGLTVTGIVQENGIKSVTEQRARGLGVIFGNGLGLGERKKREMVVEVCG
jgi:hypothetical protein